MLAVFAEKTVKLPPVKPTPQRFSSLLLHGISIQRINCNFDTKEVLQLLFCTAVNNACVPKQKELCCNKNFSTTLTANFQTKKVLQLLSNTLLLHHRSNARVTKKTFFGCYNARCNCGKGKGNNGASVYRRKRLPACVYVKNTLTKHCSCTPVVRSDTTLPSANTNNCKNICNNRHCVNLLLHDSKNWQVRAILCLRQTKKAENPPFFCTDISLLQRLQLRLRCSTSACRGTT